MRWRECAPLTTRPFLVVPKKRTDATEKVTKKFEVFLSEICLLGLFFFSSFFCGVLISLFVGRCPRKEPFLAGRGGRRRPRPVVAAKAPSATKLCLENSVPDRAKKKGFDARQQASAPGSRVMATGIAWQRNHQDGAALCSSVPVRSRRPVDLRVWSMSNGIHTKDKKTTSRETKSKHGNESSAHRKYRFVPPFSCPQIGRRSERRFARSPSYLGWRWIVQSYTNKHGPMRRRGQRHTAHKKPNRETSPNPQGQPCTNNTRTSLQQNNNNKKKERMATSTNPAAQELCIVRHQGPLPDPSPRTRASSFCFLFFLLL